MRKVMFAALILIMMTCAVFAEGENQNPEPNQPISLDEVSMTLDEEVFYKTGVEIIPIPALKYGGDNISEEEYSLQYSNNINVGTATVRATFKEGTFAAGTKEVTFEILPAKPQMPALADGRPL